ncbi:hypothetical protein E4634_18420 [Mangrovimicrobium sediminis]|uniref:Midcut-by-XrtH protein n=1 Tax=Mangrovimicrobium sediminis TaxID=2562682 RepID=A0A4Z0LWL2_9GAMM|nr:hypothetical protein [Haliea sp. SAOS-164]TGD71614.1 hypothetical protein E4634_18420 [Haliea sp. SAOS-164]
MRRTDLSKLGILLVAGLCLPGLAHASFVPVVVELAAVSPAVQAVPVLSPGLLAALALVLVVIGLRVVRSRGAQRSFLGLLAGAGLLLAVAGVEHTRAVMVIPVVPPTDPACNNGSIALDTGGNGFSGVMIQNACETTTLEVQGYLNLPCAPVDQIVTDADIGDRIAPGASATTNYCLPPS